MDIEATMVKEQNLTKTQHVNDTSPVRLGTALRAAREAQGLTEKEAGLRLNLNPKIIELMENEDFLNGPPATFMRGYLRSYGRLLNISPESVNTFIAQIEPIIPQSPQPAAPPILNTKPLQSGRRIVRMTTYLIIASLASLVGIWWSTHTKEKNVPVPKETPAVVVTTPIATQPAATTQPATPTTQVAIPSTTIPTPESNHPSSAIPPTPTASAAEPEKNIADTDMVHAEPGLEQSDEEEDKTNTNNAEQQTADTTHND